MDEINIPETAALSSSITSDPHFIILAVVAMAMFAIALRILHRNATKEFVYDPHM